MRKLALTVAATAAILAVGSLSAYRAEAMTLGGPAGVRGAIDAISPVEKTACWRWGWHGWGWYPCGEQANTCQKCRMGWGSKYCWKVC